MNQYSWAVGYVYKCDAQAAGEMCEELERDGFIVSQTGKGSFVKGQDRELVREEYLRQTEQLIAQACDKARTGGITAEEIHELVDIIYNGE